MEKIKKIIATMLAVVICAFTLCACDGASKRGPLDIKQITYVVHPGDMNTVYMYVFTPDMKLSKYTITPDDNKTYDYLNGELPPEECCKIDEYEMEEPIWTSIKNIFTRVDIMNLKEDMSSVQGADDGSSYYIKIETEDGVNETGGFAAGEDDDSDSRRFSEARGILEEAIKQAAG